MSSGTSTSHVARVARPGRSRSLVVLVLCQVCAMSVWFSASAVAGIVGRGAGISEVEMTMLTSAVQAGFVSGTILSALMMLPDRFDPRRIFMISALVAAAATGLLAFLEPVSALVIGLRFITGVSLAGVYPIGMRLAATWADRDLGLLIGLLVGALTLGSAMPHLLSALGGQDWRLIYAVAASLAALAGVAILACGLGPNITRATAINFSALAEIWRDRAIRLANFGYLGHMWELYTMWAWLAAFLTASFAASGVDEGRRAAEVLTFSAIAAGALGAWLGGVFADRFGRTTVTIAAMAASGLCAIATGASFGASVWIVAPLTILWGITVIADSAQFSASIAELAPKNSVGTLLTAQTCSGFLLTLVSIHLLPYVVAWLGWALAFALLAIGPLLGCVAMARLRRHPRAVLLAGGKR